MIGLAVAGFHLGYAIRLAGGEVLVGDLVLRFQFKHLGEHGLCLVFLAQMVKANAQRLEYLGVLWVLLKDLSVLPGCAGVIAHV